jgi:hypothetical protein
VLYDAYSDSAQALYAMLRRKRLAISDSEWKSIPWKVVPKDLKDILVDVLVDIPGLLEGLDQMSRCTEADEKLEQRQMLIRQCWELDEQLIQWLRLVRGLGNPGSHSLDGPSESIVIHVAIIHGMSLYWITCIILYSTLRALSVIPEELPQHTHPELYINKLTPALKTLLDPRAGLYGRHSAALLVELAAKYATEALAPLKES